jgi:hypothetical protein
MSPNTVLARRGGVAPPLCTMSPNTWLTVCGACVPTICTGRGASAGRSATSASSSAVVTAA